jgi:uncharacterized protein YggE
MRKMLIVIFILFSISLFSDEIKNNKINIVGKSELNIMTDQAHIEFTVEGFGSTLRQAVDTAKEKVANVSKDLLVIGVKEDNLSTMDFYSGNNFRSKQFLSSKKDFRTEITTKIVVDSLDILEEIILTLSDNEIKDIADINFTLSNYDEYKNKCRELALINAKEKVEQISKELNVKITGIFSLKN